MGLSIFKSKPKEEAVAMENIVAGNEKSGSDGPASDTTDSKKGGFVSKEREGTVLSNEEETISQTAQPGVQAMEATTLVWTKWHLTAAYILIWIIYFVASLEEVVIRSLNPYVTSSFSLHSLTAATYIMANIFGGLTKLPLAKIMDMWGRPQGMSIMLVIWVLGYVMMALCKNVQTYAAAQVFSATGAQGISYCLTVFVSDTTHLKNRSLMLAFVTTPYIITTWIGGVVTAEILKGPGFRWGFGIFAITIPIAVMPLILLFLWNQRKARRLGLITHQHSRLDLATIKRYAIEVDLFGITILAAGMALFLLPFSIYSYQAEKWRSPMIICMLVFGAVLIGLFLLYEKYCAPVTFIPVKLLYDRTVFFGGMMFVFLFFQSMIWNSYFLSMCQVVYSLKIRDAVYVSNIYRTGSCLFGLVVGVLIKYTGRFKWLNLYFAMPLTILANGLLIHFRVPGTNIGYIVMTQIFIAVAGGTAVLCGEMAMMAPSDHQHIAVILAILNLFSSVGAAAGGTVSTAIWTSVFPVRLDRYLPKNVDRKRVYGSLIWQLAYKVGTPERDAINRAYGDTQRLMLITSLSLLGGGLICTALWRDINLKNMKQVKGVVV